MKLSDIRVYITQRNNGLNHGIDYGNYYLKVNKFLKKIILKLEKDNVIDQVKYVKNSCSFRPCNLIEFKKLDRLNVNNKNYKKIVNQFLDPYSDILISTSQGIFNLQEAINKNIGGILLAKYTKKYENNI